MDLFNEILIKRINNQNCTIVFTNSKINQTECVELKCYKTLNKIKHIIHDDRLNDHDCFMKIEEIIIKFEELGSNGGFRHDFG